MPYAMLDDMLWADPMIAGLTDGAQALLVRAVSYSANQLLDGFVPQSAGKLYRLSKRYSDELVAKGVWEWHPADSPLQRHCGAAAGWLQRDWQKWMKPRGEVLQKREQQKQRVRGFRNALQTSTYAAGNAAPNSKSNSNIQREEADASSSPAAPIAIDTEIRGFNFVASLLGRSQFDIAPVGSFRAEYSHIGGKSDADFQRVAKAVNADEWCQKNPSRVDARHLQRDWQKYLAGPVKQIVRALPQPPAAPPVQAHQLMKF